MEMNYKDKEKYLTKLASETFKNAIAILKDFTPESEKVYKINYRKESQRKDNIENFKSVKFVDESQSFLFDDKLVVKMVDINEVIPTFG